MARQRTMTNEEWRQDHHGRVTELEGVVGLICAIYAWREGMVVGRLIQELIAAGMRCRECRAEPGEMHKMSCSHGKRDRLTLR